MDAVPYQAREGFSEQLTRVFVTQDEIDAFLIRHYVFSGQNRTDVYAFFCQHPNFKERADFMRKRYGIGGASVALPGYDDFGCNYDGKGIELYKGSITESDNTTMLRWNDVAKRIGQLIEEGRYLTAEEVAKLPEYEREKIAEMVVKFYASLPKDIESPFQEGEDLLYGEVLDEIALKLSIEVDAVRLHAKMMEDLKSFVLDTDDRWAEDRLDLAIKVGNYIEGKYSIYRTEMTESEVEESVDRANEPLQLSLFDYFDVGEAVTGVTVQADREVARDGREGFFAGTQNDVVGERINYRIKDDELGVGGPKEKFRNNLEAIRCLKRIEEENRLATPEEQEVLARYVGWGGISQAFDKNNEQWKDEYTELKSVLTPEEHRDARASVLTAFYTSPVVIRAMYEVLERMGLSEGNVLEPSCGIGNFMGMLPESMEAVNMYGVEIDSITGRIAKQLYQKNSISVQGFEKTDLQDNFFDAVIGNVPFGENQVADSNYDRYHFKIHDYFIARSIDLARPGGVIAVVTSAGTMDKADDKARRYFAQRAELLGAVRLPNTAFKRNAGTEAVADILFFQKRDRPCLEEPEWVKSVEVDGSLLVDREMSMDDRQDSSSRHTPLARNDNGKNAQDDVVGRIKGQYAVWNGYYGQAV